MKKRKKSQLTKNKKAFNLLPETTVGIIIAVLAILILVYLGFKISRLYFNSDEKKITEVLDTINQKIDYLNSDEYSLDSLDALIALPDGKWYLKSHGQGFFPSKQCVGNYKTCLCICDSAGCDKLNVCKGLTIRVLVNGQLCIVGGGELGLCSETSNSLYENVLQFSKSVNNLRIYKDKEITKIEDIK